MRFLKQNTDQYISVGPFLDSIAGLGNEDALTVTSFSGVIVKSTHGSASTHTDFTPSATPAADWGMAAIGHGGLYDLKIPDSEINFVGSAKIAIWYDAEALPSWEEFVVLPANIWDSLMGTDLLDVNASQWLGNNIHATTVNGVPIVQMHDSAGAGGVNAPANFEDLAITDTTGLVAANSVPAVTLANGAHGGGAATITLLTPIAASVGSVPDSAGVSTIVGKLPAGSIGDATALNQATINNNVTAVGNAVTALGSPMQAGASVTVSDKTGFKLASDGLNSVAAPADLANDAAARGSFMGMFRALFNRFYNAVTQTAAQQVVKSDAGAAVSTMAVSDDGVTQTKGKSA